MRQLDTTFAWLIRTETTIRPTRPDLADAEMKDSAPPRTRPASPRRTCSLMARSHAVLPGSPAAFSRLLPYYDPMDLRLQSAGAPAP